MEKKPKEKERIPESYLIVEIGEMLAELADPSDPNDPISEMVDIIERNQMIDLRRNGFGSRRHLLTGGKP